MVLPVLHWIWLLIVVFSDIFRSHDLSGAKALWIIFVVIVPYLGVFVYLIARGGMQEHAAADAKRQDTEFSQYVQSATASSSSNTADELGAVGRTSVTKA